MPDPFKNNGKPSRITTEPADPLKSMVDPINNGKSVINSGRYIINYGESGRFNISYDRSVTNYGRSV